MKKFISLILIAIFIFTGIFSTTSMADYSISEDINALSNNISVDNEKLIKNNYGKIHFYTGDREYTTIENMDELNAAKAQLDGQSELVINSNRQTYATNEEDESCNEKLKITIQFKSNFKKTNEYLEYKNSKSAVKNLEEVHNAREKLNAFSKQYHTNLVLENLHLISGIEYINMEIVRYAPIVILDVLSENVNVEELAKLSQENNVEHISVGYEMNDQSVEIEDDTIPSSYWDTCMDAVNATEIIASSEDVGFGLRIGVLEAEGVCDISHPNLAGIDVTINPDATTQISDHANKVLIILYTMLPNASYYVSDAITQHGNGIEWFIDNTADVVNCSLGYRNNREVSEGIYEVNEQGYRFDVDGLYDYQIEMHDMIVIVAAGNGCDDNTSNEYNPNNAITSPGYAYNAITVGGVMRKSRKNEATGENESYWSYAYDSSYDYRGELYNAVPKPNVSAPFTVLIPGYGKDSGTSFSAPIVTACVAYLIDSDFSYAWEPALVMSNIIATATKTDDYNATKGEYDEHVGAGIINLDAMIDSNFPVTIETDDTYGDWYTQDVYSTRRRFTMGTEITISLAWLVQCEKIGTSHYPFFSNYDIYLYDSYGNLITSATITDFNTELLRYTITTTDTYEVRVTRIGYFDDYITEERLAFILNT